MEDDTGRVVVIVIAAGAHSPNELVRLGFDAERAMDCEASNCATNNECSVDVGWAASDDELRTICGEAALNNEWLSVIQRGEHVRGVVIGPVHLEHSPLLAAMVDASRKRGDA